MTDPYLENRFKINPQTSNGLSRIVSGSVCSTCNNTGWILPSNGKIQVEEAIGLRPDIRFEENIIPESEAMIKCTCGR